MLKDITDFSSDELKLVSGRPHIIVIEVHLIADLGPDVPLKSTRENSQRKFKEFLHECQRVRPEYTWLRFPSMELSLDAPSSYFSIHVRPHVLRDYLVDAVESLKNHGFHEFLVWTSHHSPRTLVAVEDACLMVSRRSFFAKNKTRTRMVSIQSAEVSSTDFKKSLLFSVPPTFPDQGGSQVFPGKLGFFEHFIQHSRGLIRGGWGRPTSEQTQKFEMQASVQRYLSLLSGELKADAFLSPYRWVLFHHSFFKAYALALILFLILTALFIGEIDSWLSWDLGS